MQRKNWYLSRNWEKSIKYVCELGCEIMGIMLERYDDELAEERNKATLRNRGKKATIIKTLCGEVEYSAESTRPGQRKKNMR